MKSLIIPILTTFLGSVHAQPPFEIEVLSSKHEIAVIKYDGSSGSVADLDTTRLRPFKFLSIGSLKRASAVSQGPIYTVLTYSNNQIVVVESLDKNASTLSDWKSVNDVELMPYYPLLKNPLKGKNRSSFSIRLENCKVHILNIKEEEVDLFKWMVTTIEFI